MKQKQLQFGITKSIWQMILMLAVIYIVQTESIIHKFEHINDLADNSCFQCLAADDISNLSIAHIEHHGFYFKSLFAVTYADITSKQGFRLYSSRAPPSFIV